MKNIIRNILFIFSGIALLISLYMVFFIAPVDANMGIVQKIFYFHVPSAYSMYLGWLICAISSALFLITRDDKWDILAKSAGNLSLFFAFNVLITGPLWGRKSWGAYWAWDPRLTSALILTLIIASYCALRFLSNENSTKKFGAALSILGVLMVPLVHFSVYKWRGQHPQVLFGDGGGLDENMLLVFLICLITFTVTQAALLVMMYEVEKLKRLARAIPGGK